MKHKKSDQLINEAVFYEINHQRWHQGLWNELKLYIPEIEQKLVGAVEYSNKYPNSPVATNLVRALSNILDSVSETYKSLKYIYGDT